MRSPKDRQPPIATIEVPSDLMACMIEITSDIGFMLDIGIDDDTVDDLAETHARLLALLEQLENAKIA